MDCVQKTRLYSRSWLRVREFRLVELYVPADDHFAGGRVPAPVCLRIFIVPQEECRQGLSVDLISFLLENMAVSHAPDDPQMGNI